MKIRQGFVSNSSSSSFILRVYPEGSTAEDIYEFYGMGDGHASEEAKRELAEYIHSKNLTNRYEGFIHEYIAPAVKEKFLDYFGYNFEGSYEYALEYVDDVFNDPSNYFEFSIEDTYMNEAGCAYKGSFITKNGFEINCH